MHRKPITKSHIAKEEEEEEQQQRRAKKKPKPKNGVSIINNYYEY